MSFADELAARRRFGMQPGLGTIRALCAALGDPQLAFAAIHVAGTNGKGAVCALIDASLRASGLRVGRYTSPHLVRLNERFFLDGAPVGDAAIEAASAAVMAAVRRFDGAGGSGVTYFEALTAVAFRLYAESAVDCAVLECGLGGRLDATNVCRPELCVITRIGLDHCDWLGGTVEQIAAEKAGIVKPGVPVVLGENEPAVRAVVAARARELGAPFHYAPDLADASGIPAGFSLPGPFNAENAVTALAALKVLAASANGRVPGFTPVLAPSVVWPGRFQRIGDVIVDGAHNPPAARALAQALRSSGDSPVALVAGFCGDKDVDEVLAILSPLAARGYAVRTNNPRSLPAAVTAAKMRAAGIEAEACGSLRAAIDAARGPDAAESVRTTLVCGGLFLAGEALVELGAYPWPAGPFDPSESLATPAAQLRPAD